MKKMSVLLVVFLAMFMVLPASAQNQIGVIGGLNLANLSSDYFEAIGLDFGTSTGFGIGGVLDVGLNENISLRFEPMYLQKGSTFDDNEEPDIELTIKSFYFEVPVLFKLVLGTSTTRPYLLVGPSIGFLLSSKLKIEGRDEDQDLKDDFKSNDFSLTFGGGVSFPAGNNSFFLEGRYNHGFKDIADFEGEGEDAEIKTKGIQIMAGFVFRFGGQ